MDKLIRWDEIENSWIGIEFDEFNKTLEKKWKIKPYFQLPVYKVIYELTLDLHKLVLLLPRIAKYSTWQKILSIMDEIWVGIFKINSTHVSDPNKKKYFLEIRSNIELVRYNFRILKDMKFFSTKQYLDINLKLEEISKQVSWWQRYFKI